MEIKEAEDQVEALRCEGERLLLGHDHRALHAPGHDEGGVRADQPLDPAAACQNAGQEPVPAAEIESERELPPHIRQAVCQPLPRFAEKEIMLRQPRGRTITPPAQQAPVEEAQLVAQAGTMGCGRGQG